MQEEKSDPLFTPGPTKYDVHDLSKKGPAWTIGKLKRITMKLNLNTKGCGAYKYKSFIGEGPKYSFRKKCDENDTTDETCNTKSKNSPTPGPGAYKIKSILGGPKYTIGKSPKIKYLIRDNSVPGVGEYDLSQTSISNEPSCFFTKEKRENLELNKNALSNPGPGAYSIEKDSISSNSPKWTFSKSERIIKIKPKNKKVIRVNIPGPGKYNIKDIIGNDGPSYSFSQNIFNHSDVFDEMIHNRIKDYPSPVTYHKNIDYIPDSPKYTIEKTERDKGDFIISKRKIKFPGPGQYNPNKCVSSTIKNMLNVIFSKTDRTKEKISDVPGPGKYTIHYGEIPQGPKYTIVKRKKTIKKDITPGPGFYSPKFIMRPREPSCVIGKEKRDDLLVDNKAKNYPGPGAYKIKEIKTKHQISFPKSKKTKKIKDIDFPGPGYYKIPTSFDNISNLARSGGSFNPLFQYV